MTAWAQAKVDLDTTRPQLEVVYAAERLGGLLEDPVKHDLPSHRFPRPGW